MCAYVYVCARVCAEGGGGEEETNIPTLPEDV